MKDFGYGFTQNDYEAYKNKESGIKNEKLRGKEQTFAEAMCEDSIVAAVKDSEKENVLKALRKVGGIS